MSDAPRRTAEQEFHTSSNYVAPKGYIPWVIANDYPILPQAASSAYGGPVTDPGRLPPGSDPTPWLQVDFKTEPLKYINLVKEYFLEGNIEADFVPQKNKVRRWYHAAWLHYGEGGREPIRGLTYEGATPPYNLAKGQSDYLGSWANAFFNDRAATVLGGIWKDPNNPQTSNIKFPEGSVVTKALFTTATDDQLPSQKGAPVWQVAISPKPDSPQPRNNYASPVRLIQLDVAVTDSRAPSGWIFGSYWYNGLALDICCIEENEPTRRKWDRLLPIGLQFGNDPELTQAAYEAGERPKESWVNPEAVELLKQLGGKRPFIGWNDRMNGPADGFISACLSCHSVAQIKVPPPAPSPVQPTPVEGPPGHWTPPDDKIAMRWFRNIPNGEPFTAGAISTDFNMQTRGGLNNYFVWRNPQKLAAGLSLTEEENLLAGNPLPVGPRGGPEIKFL